MKHATGAALDQLEPLLEKLRRIAVLKEKSRGAFYFKSSALLHFHEDPRGLFADLRDGAGWVRLPVNTNAGQAELLRQLGKLLSA